MRSNACKARILKEGTRDIPPSTRFSLTTNYSPQLLQPYANNILQTSRTQPETTMSSTNNNTEALAHQMPTGGSGEFNPKPAGAARENHDGVSTFRSLSITTFANILHSTSPVSSSATMPFPSSAQRSYLLAPPHPTQPTPATPRRPPPRPLTTRPPPLRLSVAPRLLKFMLASASPWMA